jgi:hypothetical protein
MDKLDYFKKITDKKSFSDIEWNIPEQKTGTLTLVGGNRDNFSFLIRSAENLENTKIKTLKILLPDALQNKLPPLPNLSFLPSTSSGSIAKSKILDDYFNSSDFVAILGDLSKNSETAIAIANAIKNTKTAVLLTRDAIDLTLPEMPNLIERENLFFVGSAAQIQKLFRAVYYPKVLLLSMPLIPVVEALHKFTLSYPATILTFHQEQILIAKDGKIFSIPLEKTDYTPISLVNSDLATKIAANNLLLKNTPLEATALSVF